MLTAGPPFGCALPGTMGAGLEPAAAVELPPAGFFTIVCECLTFKTVPPGAFV
jgi:hypothetical protein